MSETRVITYMTPEIATTATDSVGNLCIDKEGNVIIPIHTFYVHINVIQPRGDMTTLLSTTLTVELPNGESHYTFTNDNLGEVRREELYSVIFAHHESYGGYFICFNSRDMVERFGKSFTVRVRMDREYEPPKYVVEGETCYDIYKSYGQLSIGWYHGQSNRLYANMIPDCSLKPYCSGKFTVDLSAMTISTDDDSESLSFMPELCDKICGEDDDSHEVTAYCDVELCSDAEISVYRSQHGYNGNWLFSSSKVTVTVHPDRGETPESELQKAAICSVINEDYRKYIVTSSIDPKRYYRDESKDEKGDSDTITAYKCQKDDDANDNLWVEKRHTDANVTGRVWSKVWEGPPAAGVGKPEYLATKNVVATDLEWEYRSEESDFTADIYLDDGYHPCTATYGGVNSFICNGTFHMQLYFFLMPKDDYPQLERFIVYGMVYAGEEISVEEYFQLYLDSIGINPRAECDGDGHLQYEDYEFNIGGSVTRNGTGETGFYYNDKFYVLVPSGDEGYVYGESEVNAYAWSLSPCYSGIDTTIYTEKDYGDEPGGFGVGDAYAIMVNGELRWEGNIVASGNALYSVTGSDGIVRYWKADIDVQEETDDEEFE